MYRQLKISVLGFILGFALIIIPAFLFPLTHNVLILASSPLEKVNLAIPPRSPVAGALE